MRILHGILVLAGGLAAASCGGSALDFAWPPAAGEEYPGVQLTGLDGASVNLADYRGKVLLIEPVGMT